MMIKKSSSGELATVKIEFQKLWFRVPQRRRKPVETGFKNTNFFVSSWQKWKPSPNEYPFPSSPYPTLFKITQELCRLVFTPKQL